MKANERRDGVNSPKVAGGSIKAHMRMPAAIVIAYGS